jgi:alpha-glucosidase
MTTHQSRLNDFELLAALDSDGKAAGDLFLDDGESWPLRESLMSYIYFSVDPTPEGFRMTAAGMFSFEPKGRLNSVFILGLPNAPKSVALNDMDLARDKWHYDSVKNELVLRNLAIPLTGSFVITGQN